MMIVEAVVGAVFGELLKAVLEIKNKAVGFKPSMVNLQSILTALTPIIREIEQHNKELGHPKEQLESLIKQMEEGRVLVCRCLKMHKLNYLGRVRYHDKLEVLKHSLFTFFNINMQAQMARDQKKMQRVLKENSDMLRRLSSAVGKMALNTVGASSDSTSLPVKVIESDTNHYIANAQSVHEDSVNAASTSDAVMNVSGTTISNKQAENTMTFIREDLATRWRYVSNTQGVMKVGEEIESEMNNTEYKDPANESNMPFSTQNVEHKNGQ